MSITFDGQNKLITLSLGTTSLSVRDLWSRSVDWWLTSDNSKYLFPFEQVGGNAINESAGTYIPIYTFLLGGWRIRPQEANHTLRVYDGILLVSGGGDPFVNTLGNYIVRINYEQPVQAITVATGGGTSITPEDVAQAVKALLQTYMNKIDELHLLEALDAQHALVVTNTSRTVGTINQTIETNETQTTVQRI